MRGAWVVVRDTKDGKQYLAEEAPSRKWSDRLGMAKVYFNEQDAEREASGKYHTEKISL